MELSPELAEDIFWYANWVLVGALVVGVLATYAIVVSGDAKERHLKHELSEKDLAFNKYKIEAAERVATLETSAAEAGARQKEAELALQRVRRVLNSRTIPAPEFLELLEPQPKGDVEILYLRDDSETHSLAFQIAYLLQQAKWIADVPIPLPPAPPFSTVSAIQLVGGNPTGVTLVTGAYSAEDNATVGLLMKDPKTPASAWAILMFGLSKTLRPHLVVAKGDPSVPAGKIRIVVAPRL